MSKKMSSGAVVVVAAAATTTTTTACETSSAPASSSSSSSSPVTASIGVGGSGGGGGGVGGGVVLIPGPGGTSTVPRNRNNRTGSAAVAAAAAPSPPAAVVVGTPSSTPVTTVSHAPAHRGSKTCCFCWCCCCSCSWRDTTRCLTDKNNEENNARNKDLNKLDIFNGENEPSPTLEDMRAWGESFDKLMKSSAGRKVFRDFLKCEYSEENILFWLACEDLKRESTPEVVEEKARLIYEDYISILSPKEVSLDSRVREMINRNMVDPSPHTFDEAQLQIYTLMHRDSYPRFVNSPMYRKLAQLNSSSRKESTA